MEVGDSFLPAALASSLGSSLAMATEAAVRAAPERVEKRMLGELSLTEEAMEECKRTNRDGLLTKKQESRQEGTR